MVNSSPQLGNNPSLAPEFSTTVVNPPQPTGNTHHMVTWSKAGIFKHKVLAVETIEHEPRMIDEAFAHEEWRLAAQVEYDALIHNRNWELVPLPPGRKAIRFVKSKYDVSLFIRITDVAHMYVFVYVDDTSVTGSLAPAINVFVEQLHSMFSLKDIGDLHYFLGVEVTRLSDGTFHLCQPKYVLDLLDYWHLVHAKAVHTPMVSYSFLSKTMGTLIEDPSEYRSLFMHTPTDVHFVALKQILRYLSGMVDNGLLVRPSKRLYLVGYVDVNWGLDFDDQWSTIGYLAANLILHLKFKHVELDLFFVCEKVVDGPFIVGEILACDQVADFVTKPL
ncbi:hypothetical protein EPI10_011049 [Gossypium australe]|uniref:Reverse transcriptase Ty1/copia-type domain-containing protein n=1 Tax=Gossypium australe TaxID=47621 RepID=A0A5B6W7Q5_9ROSI|nr:hypothetical protein EPI10_011049 [Gossypium australe]